MVQHQNTCQIQFNHKFQLNMHIHVILVRMTYFTVYHSIGLLLITIAKLLNNLDAETKNSTNLSLFKSKLKKHQNVPKSYLQFSLDNGKENSILCQLRKKSSNLNAHLFKNFYNQSRCLYCRSESEGNVHFFWDVQDKPNKEIQTNF